MSTEAHQGRSVDIIELTFTNGHIGRYLSPPPTIRFTCNPIGGDTRRRDYSPRNGYHGPFFITDPLVNRSFGFVVL